MQTKEERKKKRQQYYIDNAEKIKEHRQQYYIDNKENILEKCKQYQKDNVEKNKEYQKQYRYNVTQEQYNQIFDKQNGCCAICKKHQSEFKKALDIDHNHTTGKIRGLLCMKCNRGLGYFDDNTNKLDNASSYLKNNN